MDNHFRGKKPSWGRGQGNLGMNSSQWTLFSVDMPLTAGRTKHGA